MRSLVNALRALVLSSIVVLALACSKGGGGPPDKKGPKGEIAFPVEIRVVEARAVEYAIAAVGSVQAFEEVSITSRVTGVVESVRFKEGDIVKKGDALIEIEPRRFQLGVASAQAVYERAQAVRADAESSLVRREKMAAEGVVSADDLQSYRTRATTARADEAAAKASLGLAQLNLRDAYVRAPIDGVVQTRTVRTGQFAQPGTVLATILRTEPMLLRFEIPEADAGRVKPGMSARFTVHTAEPMSAAITHVAQSANESSRMVPVVAEIPSPPASIRPGSFAEVMVPVGGVGDAPVVPETAIRPSDKGFLAFVVDGSKARERVLTLGMRTKDGLVEVRSGLTVGESLVVRGAEALQEGSSVRVADKPGGSASGPAQAPPPPPSAGPQPTSTSTARPAANPQGATP